METAFFICLASEYSWHQQGLRGQHRSPSKAMSGPSENTHPDISAASGAPTSLAVGVFAKGQPTLLRTLGLLGPRLLRAEFRPLVYKSLGNKRNSVFMNMGCFSLICFLFGWLFGGCFIYLEMPEMCFILKPKWNESSASSQQLNWFARVLSLHFSAHIHMPSPQQTGSCVNTDVELLLFPSDV